LEHFVANNPTHTFPVLNPLRLPRKRRGR
jgi:hypothetical protein